MTHVRRALLGLAFVAYVGLVLLVVLAPTPTVASSVVIEVIDVGRRLGVPEALLVGTRVEFALNTLMVVPVSLLGSLLWPALSWRDWLAIGFIGSAAVELAQGLLLPERSATFVDIVANALGAGVGAIVVVAGRALIARG